MHQDLYKANVKLSHNVQEDIYTHNSMYVYMHVPCLYIFLKYETIYPTEKIRKRLE